MKKLKLNLANMPDTQVLTREQLKKITGGNVGSGESGSDNDCEVTKGFFYSGPMGCCMAHYYIITKSGLCIWKYDSDSPMTPQPCGWA